MTDPGEPTGGGPGVQQPGQRLPLPEGLRQGRVLPHPGPGAGTGAGGEGLRDEGLRGAGPRRSLHAGRGHSFIKGHFKSHPLVM